MGLIKEFKEFAVRGNLVDTAVAFVMGVSFGKIVTSFVDGMVMPLVGMLTGGVDFNDKKWVLQEAMAAVKDAAGTVVTPEITEVSVKYGAFITNLITPRLCSHPGTPILGRLQHYLSGRTSYIPLSSVC